MLSVPTQNNVYTTPTRDAIFNKKFVPSPFVLSPVGPELEELKSKQSKTRTCQRRPKHKIDAVKARVVMYAEFLDKENENPKVQEEHTDVSGDTFNDREKLTKVWNERSKELKAMFDDVDAFELSTTDDSSEEEDSFATETEEADIVVVTKRKPKTAPVLSPKSSTRSRRRKR